MAENLRSLVVIAAIAAFVPLLVGLLRIKVAEVVLLLAGGIVFGPYALGWITVDPSIDLLAELGLGMLFFLAGMELERRAVTGRDGRLAAVGWVVSLIVAGALATLLTLSGRSTDTIGIAIALTSTALGTLLPVLRDRAELGTRFGTLFMGAGAWGEFGPIIAISVLLSTKSSFAAIVSLIAFGVVALIVAWLPRRFGGERVRLLLDRGHYTSSQTAVRFTMLVLIFLLATAGLFGLDVVLGAFVAGVIVRQLSPPTTESMLQVRIEAIGFGFLVPVFFVVSGANLNVLSIIENPLLTIRFLVYLLIARGLVHYVLYRRTLPDRRERARFALYVATGLPIIVAVTTIETAAGLMQPENAAALVGAGALSVLIFPLLGNAIGRVDRGRAAQARAANTA